jgi:hypothetical protein
LESYNITPRTNQGLVAFLYFFAISTFCLNREIAEEKKMQGQDKGCGVEVVERRAGSIIAKHTNKADAQ